MQENSTQTVQEQQIEPQQVTGENINNTKKAKVKKVFKIVAIVLAFILTMYSALLISVFVWAILTF